MFPIQRAPYDKKQPLSEPAAATNGPRGSILTPSSAPPKVKGVLGGNALKFYASVRLDIRRIEQIKDKDQIVGNQTRVKVVKNKVAPPFKITEFDILYGEGISKEGEIIDLGVAEGFVEKSGSWYSFNGNRIGQGRENAKKFLLDNKETADEIEGMIRKKNSTSEEEQEQLEEEKSLEEEN